MKFFCILETLDIKGQTITIDAMGCQKEIAKYIINKDANYILAVKDNHKTFHEQIKSAFKTSPIVDVCNTLEKGHGRIEERTCQVITDLRFVDESCNWDKLHSIICITIQGAKSIKITAPLSEVITFHISKKTFMTNFLAKGGSLLTAMSITGNKDFKTARRYYKVVDSLKSDEMAKVFG